MGYIYKIINTINGKCYIGQSIQKDIRQRWSGHKKSIKTDKGCPLLTKAFIKYGFDNFKFKVLMKCWMLLKANILLNSKQ